MSHKLALISTVERYRAWDLSDDNVQGYCCKIARTDTHGRYRAQILTEDVVHEYRCTPIQEVGVYYIHCIGLSLIIDLKNYVVVLMKRESTN